MQKGGERGEERERGRRGRKRERERERERTRERERGETNMQKPTNQPIAHVQHMLRPCIHPMPTGYM